MTTLLSIIIIIASILLIAVIFVQNPQGGGLSSDFGASSQIGGVQKTNEVIDKTTWILMGIIVVFSIVLTIKSTPKRVVMPQQATEQNQPVKN